MGPGDVVTSCPSPSPPANVAMTDCDVRQAYAANYSACQAECCNDRNCLAWNWDNNLSYAVAPAVCKAKGAPYSCCWLKNCVGRNITKRPFIESWSGRSGRKPSCVKS